MSTLNRGLDRLTAIAIQLDSSSHQTWHATSRSCGKCAESTEVGSTRPIVPSSDLGSHSRACHTLRTTARSRRYVSSETGPPGPAALFEGSSSFFPENYATDQRVPVGSLRITAFCEKTALAHSRTNLYHVHYMRASRRWSSLYISLRIPSDSSYWPLTKLSSTMFEDMAVGYLSGPATMPPFLLAQISALLRTLEEFEDDTIIFLAIPEGASQQVQKLECSPRSLPEHLCMRALSALSVLNSMGLPRYVEQQVIQVAQAQDPDFFMS